MYLDKWIVWKMTGVRKKWLPTANMADWRERKKKNLLYWPRITWDKERTMKIIILYYISDFISECKVELTTNPLILFI